MDIDPKQLPKGSYRVGRQLLSHVEMITQYQYQGRVVAGAMHIRSDAALFSGLVPGRNEEERLPKWDMKFLVA